MPNNFSVQSLVRSLGTQSIAWSEAQEQSLVRSPVTSVQTPKPGLKPIHSLVRSPETPVQSLVRSPRTSVSKAWTAAQKHQCPKPGPKPRNLCSNSKAWSEPQEPLSKAWSEAQEPLSKAQTEVQEHQCPKPGLKSRNLCSTSKA